MLIALVMDDRPSCRGEALVIGKAGLHLLVHCHLNPVCFKWALVLSPVPENVAIYLLL